MQLTLNPGVYMSFDLILDTPRRTAMFFGQGSCDYVDFCVALNSFLNDPQFRPGMSLLWDWQRSEILLASTQVRSLVETMSRLSTAEHPTNIAIVASMNSHATAEMFRKHTEAMSPHCRVLLFNNSEQAAVWTSGTFTDHLPAMGKALKNGPLGIKQPALPANPVMKAMLSAHFCLVSSTAGLILI